MLNEFNGCTNGYSGDMEAFITHVRLSVLYKDKRLGEGGAGLRVFDCFALQIERHGQR